MAVPEMSRWQAIDDRTGAPKAAGADLLRGRYSDIETGNSRYSGRV